MVAANDLAESRLRDKAAADKEWGRRLAAKDKEAAAKLRDAEFKLKELEEKGERCLRHVHTLWCFLRQKLNPQPFNLVELR